jgi:hypothetical protein
MYEAFKLGWQIGEKLNEQFTKYLPNWTKSWDDLAASVLGYEKNVKSLSQVLEDPKYGFTAKTQAMAGQIASREAAARQRAVTQDGEVIDYGSKLMEAYYTDRLRKQQEANRKAEAEAKRNADALKKIYEEVFKYAGPGQQRIPAIAAGATSVQGLQSLEMTQWLEWLRTTGIEVEKILDEGSKAVTAAAKESAEEWKKTVEDVFHSAIADFSSQMADVFTAGMIDGARGFADAASSLFAQNLSKSLQGLIGDAVTAAFGGAPVQRAGETDAEFKVRSQGALSQQQAIMTTISALVGTVGRTLQIFADAQKGKAPSVVGTILSFGVTGATIGSLFPGLGTIIGAAIGVIAGAIVGVLGQAKAKAQQPYAAYGIEGGVPYVRPFEGMERNFLNVSAQQQHDMIRQMTETLEDTQNQYISLLLKFPKNIYDGVVAGITAESYGPTMTQWKNIGASFLHYLVGAATGWGQWARWAGAADRWRQQGEGGEIGNPLEGPGAARRAAREQWMSDFQNWVNNTLPQQIIDTFKEPLARGFEELGLDAERFAQIWDRIRDIEPKEAIETLNKLFDALSAFKGFEEWVPTTASLYGGPGFQFGGGALDQARAQNTQSFADALAQADVSLYAMGETMTMLIGPDQVAAAKEWGDALLQRQKAVQEFFQQIAKAIDNVYASYQKSIRELTLEGMVTPEGAPDTQAQINFLKTYADQLWGQIQRATTPEQVTQYSQELQETILRIKQLGGTMGADAAEAYRKWAIEQLTRAQDLVVDQLEKLAQDVADQNQAFLDSIEDFIEAFRNATAAINETTDTTTTTTEEGPPPRPTGPRWHPGDPGPGRGAPPGPPMTGELHVYVNGEYSETVVLEQSYVKRTRAARGRR